MALKKYSVFYYGHTITRSNWNLNFREPNGSGLEITGQMPLGSYSLTRFGELLSQTLNGSGTQTYDVTLDRDTRSFTITSSDIFELLPVTGSNNSTSVLPLAGFTTDQVGLDEYTGEGSGFEYITQTPLQNYTRFEDNKEKAEASVKTTPAGIVEVVSYSVIERMECEMPLITNVVPQGYIRESATGVEEVKALMDYLIEKRIVEFMESVENRNTYVTTILDATKRSKDGVGYKLEERVRDKLPYYYRNSGLVFRKVEDR